MPLKIGPGIDSVPTDTIPDDPVQFVNWFKSIALKRWFANADVRNAIPGVGVTISGTLATPATISVGDEVQSLFLQPYLFVGPAVPPAPLTDFRSIAAQASVLTLTDGGPESTLTVGVAANGIGNTELRQGHAASVIGNSTTNPANVADIVAGADDTVLLREAGALSFASLPLTAISPIVNSTVIGNVSGGTAAPTALNTTQLTTLVNRANPTALVGLTAVNGASGTMMDSASAPPLDQSISPTMTGNWVFTKNVGFTLSIGLNGVSPPAQVTGFGTPTGSAVTANFSGTAATTAQIQSSIAQILTILKAYGMIGA